MQGYRQDKARAAHPRCIPHRAEVETGEVQMFDCSLNNEPATAVAATPKGGYFTVHITSAGQSHPYIVFATSDFQAAKLVKQQTGHMASQHDVEGPYTRF